MRTKFICMIFVVCTVLSVSLCRESEGETESFFDAGNREYENGDYEKSIAEYEQARFSGKRSAALYYNLAGAYFKAGHVGRAILNYERAVNLAPRDPDIATNYGFAKSMVTGKSPPPKGFFSWWPIRMYSRFLTVNEMTIMASVLFFLLFLILGFAVVFGAIRGRALFAAAFLAVFIVFSIAVIFVKVKKQNSYAVTVVPSSDALYGPFDSATKFFTLHEGNGVIVLESKDAWQRVRRLDGMVGWVKSGEVEKI